MTIGRRWIRRTEGGQWREGKGPPPAVIYIQYIYIPCIAYQPDRASSENQFLSAFHFLFGAPGHEEQSIIYCVSVFLCLTYLK